MTTPDIPRLHVDTTPVGDAPSLIPHALREDPLIWMRDGAGMVGIGQAIRWDFTGPDRFTEAAQAWRLLTASAQVADSVDVAGTGLVAFGTFAFADGSETSSTLIVPRLVLGHRDGRGWITRVRVIEEAETEDGASGAAPLPGADPLSAADAIDFVDGQESAEGYRLHVAEAVRRIQAGDLEKTVLARDIVGALPEGADLRRFAADLAAAYPDCWTYAVDGLVGSSPETLVRVTDGTVSARVLAGTAARGDGDDADRAAERDLAGSQKDRGEHDFAVRSVVDALAPHTRDLTADAAPFTLRLPNLWHLATDVQGALDGAASSLDLAQALHPTAAVAGTPTARAVALIDELEPFDRGRYAGPVGWVDADGDGEWAIALRCAQRDGDTLTAYAGCGIVADSQPERELAETRIKFRPVVDALSD